MAAPTSFPSWAYNSLGQPALIVQSLTAFTALGGVGVWSATPFAIPPSPTVAPADVLASGSGTLTATDTRLQQILVENRVQSMMLAQAFNIPDDPQQILRPDVLANDSSLTS